MLEGGSMLRDKSGVPVRTYGILGITRKDGLLGGWVVSRTQ